MIDVLVSRLILKKTTSVYLHARDWLWLSVRHRLQMDTGNINLSLGETSPAWNTHLDTHIHVHKCACAHTPRGDCVTECAGAQMYRCAFLHLQIRLPVNSFMSMQTHFNDIHGHNTLFCAICCIRSRAWSPNNEKINTENGALLSSSSASQSW